MISWKLNHTLLSNYCLCHNTIIYCGLLILYNLRIHRNLLLLLSCICTKHRMYPVHSLFHIFLLRHIQHRAFRGAAPFFYRCSWASGFLLNRHLARHLCRDTWYPCTFRSCCRGTRRIDGKSHTGPGRIQIVRHHFKRFQSIISKYTDLTDTHQQANHCAQNNNLL